LAKLIIQHDERVTEHKLADGSAVIGRDPSCDLFFADRKLSRRHARFDTEGEVVTLVDLGSRNGSWVNEERIANKTLVPGDSLRLGSLRVQLEYETTEGAEEAPPEQAEDSATIVLTGAAVAADSPADAADAADESHTMVLGSPDSASADESATMILNKDSSAAAPADPDQSGTVILPTPDIPSPEESGTVMLPTPDIPSPEESGTVMLPTPDIPSPEESGTVILPTPDIPSPEESGTVILPTPDVSTPDVSAADESGTMILPTPDLASPDSGGDAPSADDSATMMLASDAPSKPSADDTGTVVLEAPSPSSLAPPAESSDPDESSTVILPAVTQEEADFLEPLSPPSEPDDGDEEDKTVIGVGAAEEKRQATSAFVFRDSPDPNLGPELVQVSPSTAPAEGSAADARAPDDAEAVDPSSESYDDVELELDSPSPARASSIRFVALVAGLSLLAFAVLALPLMRTMGAALQTETSLRGRLLVDLLAAENQAAFVEDRLSSLSVARVRDEPGVVAAFILDAGGEVLVPTGHSGEPPLEGLGVRASDIRAFRKSELASGLSVLATPIIGNARRVGVAVVHFRPDIAQPSGTALLLVLGSALLLMGVSVAVFLARRWSLAPVQELHADVQALQDGLLGSIPEERPYSELSEIARGFNELLQDPRISGDHKRPVE